MRRCTDELPNSANVKACAVSWAQIARLVLAHTNASFQDAVPADIFKGADATAYRTNIETESNWDALFALTGIEQGKMTGDINNHSIPEGEAVAFDRPDGTQAHNRINGRTADFMFYSPTQAQEEQLISFGGAAAKICFLTWTGTLIAPKWRTADTNPFFDASYLVAGDPGRITNSEDVMTLKARFETGALTYWDTFECPFLLTKALVTKALV